MRIGYALVAIAAGAAASAAPRPGHAVRIERERGATGQPGICAIGGSDTQCFGIRPEPGQAIAVLDTSRYLGTVHAGQIAPKGECGDDGHWWLVQIDDHELANNVTGSRSSDGAVGVFGVAFDPGAAHVVKSPQLPAGDDIQAFGIDGDGDGLSDVAFAFGPCGDPSVEGMLCINVYKAGRDHQLALARRDVIPTRCIQ